MDCERGSGQGTVIGVMPGNVAHDVANIGSGKLLMVWIPFVVLVSEDDEAVIICQTPVVVS